jgi:hypothetical protein
MASERQFSILFHGNCIDGWMSTYIAYSHLSRIGTVKLFPISPNQSHTFPKNPEISGTHILLLDVSVSEVYRNIWIEGGVLSIECIDHHESALEHWSIHDCPINTASCAALQTWQIYYPELEIPDWLYCIDRIDRWDSPSYEDRCIREILNVIAHKPVINEYTEAFILTEQFINNISTEEGKYNIINCGKFILDQKDAILLSILSKGSFHTFTEEYLAAWNLDESWLNKNVYIINNTDITLDTTEAAHLVFTHYPHIDVFINYRKKITHDKQTRTSKCSYIYSARSHGFNITNGDSIFKGHKTSAGAAIPYTRDIIMPFMFPTVTV